MSYKTIVVHVDQSKQMPARVTLAAELAVTEGAHLVGAAMTGISRFIYPDGTAGIEAVFTELRNEAYRALDQFEEIVRRIGVPSYQRRLTEDDAAGGLVLQSRYADLVVLSQADPSVTSEGSISDVTEYVMLNSARPVLTIPHTGHFEHTGRRVLIAWDGSMEATRAITNGLPLLQRASEVTLAVFNVSAFSGVHGEEPGADIALYLARHGVKVEVRNEQTRIDVGNALLSLAADQGADLLIMGGYGHTRFREVLIGGVTRTILQSMTLPVLLSH